MTTFDGHANLSYGTVLTPPSPASSGPTLTLQSGQGATFPAAPFNVVVWPAGAQAISTNAELARCTALSGDTLTVTRGPLSGDPGGTTRAIVAGDQVAAAITAKTVKDIEAAVNASLAAGNNLSDLANAATARSNLGLGTAAVVNVDATATDIAMDGVQAAGATGKVADAGHVHPTDTSRAPLASPTFTGTPAAPTPAADDSTTKLATTAYVLGQAASTNPAMDGAAAPGTATRLARIDHVHPTDTSRAPLASPTFTGTPAAPTPTGGDNTTKVATTAFVQTAVSGGSGSPILFKRGLWYVDGANGNDSTGTGTSALPYATISKAVAQAASGDWIAIAVGNYNESVYVTKPLTIEFRGSPGAASSTGSAHITAPDDFSDGIVLGPGADGTVLINPAVNAHSATFVEHGIRVVGCSEFRIVNPTFSGAAGTRAKAVGGTGFAIGHSEKGVIEGVYRITRAARGMVLGVEANEHRFSVGQFSSNYQDRFAGPYECYRTRISGAIIATDTTISIRNSADLVSGPGFAYTRDLLAAPAAPTLSAAGSGNSVPVGTYTVAVSYVNAFGETVGSATSTQVVSGTQALVVNSPAALPGATSWYAYVSQAGLTTLTRFQAAGSPTAIGTALTIIANPPVSGASPASGTTAYNPEGLWYPAGGNAANQLTGVQRAIVGFLASNITSGQTTNVKLNGLSPGNQVTNGFVNPFLVNNIPASGSLTLDPGLAGAETITYTSVTNNGDGSFTLNGVARSGSPFAHTALAACQDAAKASAAAHAQNVQIVQSNGTPGLAGGWSGGSTFDTYKGTNCVAQNAGDYVDEWYAGQIFINNDTEEGPANAIRFYSCAGASLHIRPTVAAASTVTDDSTGSLWFFPTGAGSLVLSSLSSAISVEANQGLAVTDASVLGRYSAIRAATSGTVPRLDLGTLGDGKALVYDLASGLYKHASFLQSPASLADGDVFYMQGGVLQRLPVGSNGQVLTVAASLPSWAAGGGASARDQTFRTGLGVISQNLPDFLATSSNALTSQQITCSLLPLLATDVVTNVIVWVGQAGVGTAPTLIRLGLADKTGKILAVTADVHASSAFTSTGAAIVPLSGPFTVVSTDVYYVCIVENGVFGTTVMKLNCSPGSLSGAKIGTGSSPFAWQNTQTDLPAVNSSMTLITGGSNAPWVGVS